VLTQTNLVPHLPHVARVYTIGIGAVPPRDPNIVLLAGEGTPWPLTQADLSGEIARYESAIAYTASTTGPLFVFERRPRTTASSR
jgi:hypothetical protein